MPTGVSFPSRKIWALLSLNLAVPRDRVSIICLALSDDEPPRSSACLAPAASDNGLSRGETEEVLLIGDIGVASFVFDGALVTCLMNVAIDRIQNFPGVLKGNNIGRICAASAVYVERISHPDRVREQPYHHRSEGVRQCNASCLVHP